MFWPHSTQSRWLGWRWHTPLWRFRILLCKQQFELLESCIHRNPSALPLLSVEPTSSRLDRSRHQRHQFRNRLTVFSDQRDERNDSQFLPIRGSASTAHSVPVTDSNADCRDEFECREDEGEHAESEHEAARVRAMAGHGSLLHDILVQASNNAIIASCTSTSNLAPKTVSAYEKSLKSYTKFMAETWPGACVRPIDPDMVLNFLSSESKRPARRSGTGVDQGEDIEGTTIGVSVLKNHLNALEHLRDLPPIGYLEAGWKKREAGRKKSAQTNKIEGTASDNVTKEEQLQISEHLLCQGPTVSLATLFRGDNTRALAFSDLSMRALERPDHPPIKTLYIVADSGKTNKEGRLDYKPVARHFDPRICNVGAVAFYMWFRDEYTGGLPYGSFEPDFSKGSSKYGYREWYNVPFSRAHLAATHSCIRSPTRVSRHSWCLIGGRLDRDGTFRSVYQRGDPTTSFIALAGFNGKFPESRLAEFEERFEADELCQDKALVMHRFPSEPVSVGPISNVGSAFVASVEGNGREEAASKVVYGGLLDSIVDRLGAQQSSERQSATAHLRSDNRRILELLIEQHNRGGHFHVM
ncbi:BZ3501_MvSof-1269-A2-R1_C57g00317 [Microbotryum saponariae]|nr:BZ3501_MvSof-1269-A2-R1_C57g00317 [Microbotryum saponariae]